MNHIQLADEYSEAALAHTSSRETDKGFVYENDFQVATNPDKLKNPLSNQAFKQNLGAFRTLSTLAEAVSTQLSVDITLQQALDQALTTLDVEAGAITLTDEQTGELVFRAQKGWKIHNFVEKGVHLKVGEGLSGLVLRTGRPAVSSNIQQDPRIIVDEFRDEPVQGMIIAPMRARGRVIGLLSVMSYRPHQFTEEEVALLVAVADQIGMAVDNARLFELEKAQRLQAENLLKNERRRAEEMSLLREAMVNMTGTTDLLKMLEHLAQAALYISCAPIVEIDLYTPQNNQLTLGIAQRADGSRRPLSVAPHRNPIARTALQQKSIMIHSVKSESAIFLDDIAYVVAVPMNQQVPNGVILLGYLAQPDLDEQSYTSLTMLAGQASIILDRLRLYKQERRKSIYLGIANQIGQAAVAELRNDQLLPQVTRMLQQEFDLYNVSLYLGNPLTLETASGGKPVFPGVIIKEGLPILAVKNRETLWANYIETDQRCVTPSWVSGHARSEMAIPLIHRQQVIGVLDFFSVDTGAFDELDTQILTTLSHQLAAILENVHLYNQMEQRITELTAIGDITLRLLGTLDTVSIIRAVAHHILDGMKANAVRIYPVKEERIVHPCFEISPPGQVWNEETVSQICQEGLVLREPLVTGQLEGLSWHRYQDPHPALAGGMLMFPLSDWGHLQGIVILNYTERTHFAETEQRTLNLLINLASAGLSKAVLYEDSQQQVRELSLLYKIALKTRVLTDPVKITLTVTEALRTTMGWQRAEVYFLDETTGGLILLRDGTEAPLVLPLGEGLIGWVAEHRRPLSANQGHPTQKQGTPIPNTEIAVPMVVNDRLLGVFYARSGRDKIFSKRDEDFLITVAHLLSVTLDNVELYERAQHQLQKTATLNNIIRAISHSLKLDDILQEMVRTVHNVLHTRGVCIALLNAKGDLNIYASEGVADHWEKEIHQEKRNIAHKVILTRASHYIPDTYQEKDFLSYDRSVRSVLVVPLISSSKSITGILAIDSARPYAFPDTDQNLLTSVAGQAAVAIENAHLYEDLQRRNVRLSHDYKALQELNELKDQIVQNISHELRTPLTFIKGYIELLTEGGLGPLNEEQRQSLEIVNHKANDIVRIISEILSLQQLNYAKFNPGPIPLYHTLSQIVAIFYNKADSQNVRIHLQQIDENLKLYGDQEKIKQVCYNILDNAVKFSPEGGNIWIEATIEGKNIHLCFRDEGIGIPEDKLEKIFETFYQVDGSATRQFGGLGLGLAIVQRIVNTHQGKIWAESKLNVGSAFHVLLPR
ncbi:MAG: GAF domain-containing protein, partial [Anaerolineae bacterium]|nr:GAF domain-containing protein [Anaerolineae bacterium]